MLALFVAAVLAIDPGHSKAQFSVEHVFMEHVTGAVPIVRGSVEIANGTSVPKHVGAVLDATKIHTGDDDRDGVLQTADWFDTKNFPTWTFDSTQITSTASGFTMTGSLTIHGISQTEKLTVITSGTLEHPIYHATCAIDRRAFGMKATRLDPAIGTTVDVTLDIALR